jgi:uncharacterized membrane protein YuzA (DUF378 family)
MLTVKKQVLVWLAMALAFAAPGAFAQAVDVTAAATAITGSGAAITTIGVALVGIAVIYMVFKWVKGMVKGG